MLFHTAYPVRVGARRQPRKFTPRLEILEDRSLPAPVPIALFGTGVNAGGGLLPPGPDPHYLVTASVDPLLPGPTAHVLAEGQPIDPAGPWLANGPDSRWISVQPNNPANASLGDYVYETSFDLTGYDPATAVVQGQWAAGDVGTAIRLNGALTSAGAANFGGFTGFTLNSGFVAGVNKLEFLVTNAGTVGGSTGLRTDLHGAAEPRPAITNLNLNNAVINENDTVALSGAFVEAGPANAHTVVIDWGPGQTPTTLNLAAGLNTFNANHPYLNNRPDDSAFPITVTVTNSSSASTTASTQVVVHNVLPSNYAVNTTAATITENDTLQLTGSFTDPGSLDSHRVTVYWGLGEGSTVLNLGPGVTNFNASHQYRNNSTAPGNPEFAISVGVLDSDTFITPQGPPAASNFRFAQLDWYDTAGVLQIPNSSWGTMTVDVVGDPNAINYLNVTADCGFGPAWIVRNMPIFADLDSEQVDFDISLLGLASGQNLPTLGFFHTVSNVISSTMPVGLLTTTPVQSRGERPGGDAKLGQPTLPATVGVPAGCIIPLPIPITNVIEHEAVSGIQEDPNQCFPGATARSIAWLDKTYGLGSGKTPQQIYDDLETINNATPGYGDTLKKFAEYLKNLATAAGMESETKFLDLIDLGDVEGTTRETGKDVKDWIKAELAKGEDVTLDYDTHIITVTGIFEVGDQIFLKYRDDETQGDDSSGDDTTKIGELQKAADGSYVFRRSDAHPFHKVRTVISESVYQKKVKVENAAPSNLATTLSSGSITENQSVTLSGSFTDPGSLDAHRVTVYWGLHEGSTTLELPAGVTAFSATHQYLDSKTAEHGISVALLDTDQIFTPHGDPSASNFRFGQLDWFDANGVLRIPDSSWGVMTADVVGDPTRVLYLNVTADAGNGPAWIVQNMPVFADLDREQVDFDITQLGLTSGTPLTSIGFAHTLDAAIRTSRPTGTLTTITVDSVAERPRGDTLLNQPPLPANVGVPAGIHITIPILDIDFIEHEGVSGVQEGPLQCLAGATARSIAWLDRTYGLGSGKTPQEIYNDLEALNTGSYAERVKKMAAYLAGLAAAAGMTSEVKFLDIAGLGAVEGATRETGKDVKDWIKAELAKGEDVTLDYDTHIITVTGIITIGDDVYLKYRDDETQGDNSKGDDATKIGELQKTDSGYQFRSSSGTFHNVRVVYSESVYKKKVAVSNAPAAGVSVAPSLSTVVEGGTVSLTGSFSDPGSRDRHTVEIDWGDGSGTIMVLAAGQRTFSPTHEYARPSPFGLPYVVRVTVVDDEGAGSSTKTTVMVLPRTRPQSIRLDSTTAILEPLPEGGSRLRLLDRRRRLRRVFILTGPAQLFGSRKCKRLILVERLSDDSVRFLILTDKGRLLGSGLTRGTVTRVEFTRQCTRITVTSQNPNGRLHTDVYSISGRLLRSTDG